MRVLIVEDDDTLREAMARWLNYLGYEVVGSAANGASALELLRQTRPEIITMDGELENHERGLGVARRIREEDPNVIIIMISGTKGLTFEGRGICKRDIDDLDSLRDLLAAQLTSA